MKSVKEVSFKAQSMKKAFIFLALMEFLAFHASNAIVIPQSASQAPATSTQQSTANIQPQAALNFGERLDEEDNPEVSKIIQLMQPIGVDVNANAKVNNAQSNVAGNNNPNSQASFPNPLAFIGQLNFTSAEQTANLLSLGQNQTQLAATTIIKQSAAQKAARRAKILQSLQNVIRRAQRDPNGRANGWFGKGF